MAKYTLVTVSLPTGTILQRTTFSTKHLQPLDMNQGPHWFEYRDYDEEQEEKEQQEEERQQKYYTRYETKKTIRLLDIGNERNLRKLNKLAKHKRRKNETTTTTKQGEDEQENELQFHKRTQKTIQRNLHLNGTYKETEGGTVEEIVLYGNKNKLIQIF